ncbi:MAG TPA: STAS domain-containing protein [Solirubrobacteraceae bacterium]|nr:STAS domain-containing protein [Solirubrobacteraceae bacterium]
MEGSTDEGVLRDVAADRIVDPADDRPVTADLEVQAGTRAEEPPARLDVRRVDHPLGVVLTLRGELDLATAPVLQERLDHAMRGKAAVVIDLSRLRFIGSCGLDLLVRAERHLRDSGVQLVLVRGPRAVHRVFALTSLDSHFEFCDSPSAALRTALVRRIEARRIPQPARTDRPRPSSTATSQE